MSQTSKVAGVKTNIRTESGTTHVQYHSTQVVSFNSDTITLRTGGYQTLTTKLRMNQASHQFDLGYSVFQKDYDWFVEYKGETLPFIGREMVLTR